MKFLLIGIALASAVFAEVPTNEYLPPFEGDLSLGSYEDQSGAVLADDGYRYKTVRRLRHRHRRDVSELSNEYLPPLDSSPIQAPSNDYLPPVEQQSNILADDGYRYKTVRRLRHRRRRDVSELSNEYLPPFEQSAVQVPSNDYLPPVDQQSNILADDGYRYKTVRRLRHRRRRDVSELSNEYLPPFEQSAVQVPSNDYLPPVEQQSNILADDGYRYKTVRRLRHRRRRDVSELSNEYLPPFEQSAVQVPSNDYLPPVEQQSNILADDGYRYKTVRRLRHRRRRDVSELSNEYLPPFEQSAVQVPSNDYLPPVDQQSNILADDGYRYKTVRRLRHRRRRDVSELSNEYLPPFEQSAVQVPSNDYLPPVEQQSNILADDGYRYKTVRRLRHRRRRDVSELSNEYLPPFEQSAVQVPSNDYLPPVEQQSNILADDGYRYRTVRRRLRKYRTHRH